MSEEKRKQETKIKFKDILAKNLPRTEEILKWKVRTQYGTESVEMNPQFYRSQCTGNTNNNVKHINIVKILIYLHHNLVDQADKKKLIWN